MDIQNSAETWHITYHFVWQPMRAKPCLVGDVAERLRTLVLENAHLLAFETLEMLVLPDTVYLAASASPTVAPHRIVCQVKALTSRALREEFPELTRIPTLWTRAYLVLAGDAFTIEEVLRRFAATQQPRRPRGRPRTSRPSGDEPEGDDLLGHHAHPESEYI